MWRVCQIRKWSVDVVVLCSVFWVSCHYGPFPWKLSLGTCPLSWGTKRMTQWSGPLCQTCPAFLAASSSKNVCPERKICHRTFERAGKTDLSLKSGNCMISIRSSQLLCCIQNASSSYLPLWLVPLRPGMVILGSRNWHWSSYCPVASFWWFLLRAASGNNASWGCFWPHQMMLWSCICCTQLFVLRTCL